MENFIFYVVLALKRASSKNNSFKNNLFQIQKEF